MKNKIVSQLKKDVLQLARPEGRLPGTEGHARARRCLVKRLKGLSLQPYNGNEFERPYSVQGEHFCNIVGTIKSDHPERKPILLGAHYDSVIAAPCADDNAAAISILLSAAEYLKKMPVQRDVIFAFFDAEEAAYFQSASMGSIRFYEDQMDHRGVHAAIIMDLVGHDVMLPKEFLDLNPAIKLLGKAYTDKDGLDVSLPFLRDFFFVVGTESHPYLRQVLQKVKNPRGLRIISTLNRYVGDLSDHHIFRVNQIPYLFFSCGRWRHYHMPTDIPDRLNYKKMEKILRYLIFCTMGIGGISLPEMDVTFDHTLEYEIETFRKSCGLFLPTLLKSFGMKLLESRDDIDKLVDKLISAGL